MECQKIPDLLKITLVKIQSMRLECGVKSEQEIIEKIRKLLALAGSSNEAEAASAALKVQELLQKYNLSEREIRTGEDNVGCTEIESGRRQAKWRMVLLNGIAPAYFAQLLVFSGRGGYSYRLVGKPHNVEIASSMYGYLSGAINRISRDNDIKKMIRSSAEAFRLGMTCSIIKRLDKKRKGPFAGRIFGKALVYNLYVSEKALTDSYITNMGNVKYRSSDIRTSKHRDFQSGINAGKRVSLYEQINNPEKTDRLLEH